MTQVIEKIAVLFADISGSTGLYANLGDDVARRLIAQCLADLRAEIPEHQGVFIKTLGDEVMCTFPSTEQAFHAARAMQLAVKNGCYEGGQKMSVRIGFHYGEVIRETADVYGDTVNIAARVVAITRAGHIMTTWAATESLPAALRANVRQIMRAKFKGKQESFDLFQVLWEPDDGLSTRIGMPAFRKFPLSKAELVLTYRNQSAVVNQAHKSVMLGRDPICDIVVAGDLVSRQHVCVELRIDQFIITDQSTNGTFVQLADTEARYLVREEMMLLSSGTISLGKRFPNEDDWLTYSIHAPTPVPIVDLSEELS
jgi:class 3 adenylate cyclase